MTCDHLPHLLCTPTPPHPTPSPHTSPPPPPLQEQSTGAWIFNKWGQAGADIPGASFLQWCPGEPNNREVEQCAAFTRECPGDVYRAGLISTGCRARQTTMCSRDHSCSECRGWVCGGVGVSFIGASAVP